MPCHGDDPPLLQQLLLTSAQRWPDRLALVCGATQLRRDCPASSSLARSLQAAGVARGERVLFMHTIVSMQLSPLGVLMADAVVCPVHPARWRAKLAGTRQTREHRPIWMNAATNVIEAATGASHLRSRRCPLTHPPEA